ncbi:Sterile alpha motif [Teratosphaeria destructans]|uniref:Sterile alpha motif n=1 Tax=Teratosphaeria destructans TaxID=418781 RepID=A0A9W7W4G7_9PEZI|nr:Sterile alpha motif [Teratosphaeria destructans]
MASRSVVKGEAHPGSILLVIHDFLARSADELSLAKGDRIELIERDDDFGDGWFLGRHMGNGSTGLFPEVYTTPAPKGTLTGGPHQRRVSEGVSKSASSDAVTAASTQLRHSAGSARPANGSQSAMLAAGAALRTSLPTSSPAPTAARINITNDSPVMNEALAVIDEHITDMKTPRPSYMNGNHKRDNMSGTYSHQQHQPQQQPLNRLSYIPGHETDEDEQALHTEEEVAAWTPDQVAEYLEDHGVERSHCDVFRDQEITGEVLLAMDQSSLFIKEFELGPVGRRLKTWHKIKALQDEVRAGSIPAIAKSASEYSLAGVVEDDATSMMDVTRARSSTTGTVFPRGLEPQRHSFLGDGQSYPLQPSSSFLFPPQQAEAGATANISRAPSNHISTLQNTPVRNDNTSRPSAQSIRAMQHARRHSSIDSTNSVSSSRPSHRKHPSFDRAWKAGASMKGALGSGLAALNTAAFAGGSQPTSPVSPSGSSPHVRTKRSGSASKANNDGLISPGSPGDLDRGYFSSNELDNRTTTGSKRNSVLTKKTPGVVSPIGSRANSTLFGGSRQSTISSNDPVSPLAGVERSGMFSSFGSKWHSMRSATTPGMKTRPMTDLQGSVSPVVTKLEYNEQSPSIHAALASSDASSKNASPSPSTSNLGFFSNQRSKISGLRQISDAVTNKEKHQAESPIAEDVPPTLNEKGEIVSSPTRTGSTTPSTEARSSDLRKSGDGQSRASTGSGNKLMPPQPAERPRRRRPKTKKATSAYTRGLQKKTPAESMEDCDYSGWMKKKSGSLMTTWKTRLFILKGRRLSYYYSNDDTEEKGLIDISFHRVLPATDETLTSMHAAVTGAASTPTPASPPATTPQTAAERDLAAQSLKGGETKDSGLFIFKLVPPKSGLSKGVNFTKPTVHYFAVNSRQEGRLWMAALMKATIDRDGEGVVTTTYNQKTISLAKARARKERPPALQEEVMEGRVELEGSEAGSMILPPGVGLGLGAFLMDTKNDPLAAVGGAEHELPGSMVAEDSSSIAPSATFTTASASATAAENLVEMEAELDRKEREAVALHVPA